MAKVDEKELMRDTRRNMMEMQPTCCGKITVWLWFLCHHVKMEATKEENIFWLEKRF